MSKDQKPEIQNKHGILHLLEYCQIDRAAELLGCQVCDLLHFEEIGSIKLYWHFKFQPATILPSEEDETAVDRLTIHAFAAPVDEGADFPNPHNDTPALISGLWPADDRLTKPLNDLWSPESALRGSYICTAFTPLGEMTAILPDEWKEPPENELFITRGDIKRLCDAINSGAKLGFHDWPYDEPQHQDARWIEQSEKYRTTNKQCLSWLLALQLAGFTEDDFSSNELKNKILAKADEMNIDSSIKNAFSRYRKETIKSWVLRGKS